MSDWQEAEEEQEGWPVKYPTRVRPGAPDRRSSRRATPRWTSVGKVEASELQKRLLWLLLAIEIGVALAAACVLPLIFVPSDIFQEGIIATLLREFGSLLGLSRQVACLILALPIAILLFTLGFGLWLLGQIRRHTEETGNHMVDE